MDQFGERLPWRIAALAGLLVGGVSLAAGTDLWQSLLRVGAAFAVFGLAGLVLRALLCLAPSEAARGRRVDHATPPLGVEDVAGPADGAGREGDESRK